MFLIGNLLQLGTVWGPGLVNCRILFYVRCEAVDFASSRMSSEVYIYAQCNVGYLMYGVEGDNCFVRFLSILAVERSVLSIAHTYYKTA